MRTIDADKLKYITMQKTELPPSVIQEFLQLIEEQKTIEIKQRTSHLTHEDDYEDAWCDYCGSAFDFEVADIFYNYCPYCGSEFIKEGEEDGLENN